MKKYTMVSVFCMGISAAQAQNSPPLYSPPPYQQPQYYYYPQPDQGLYLRAGVGPSFYQDGKLTEFGGGPYGQGPNAPVKYETGAAANVAVGWAFNRFVSADFETGFQGTRIDYVPGYFQYNHSDVYDIPFLANAILSFPIPHTIVTPYIGAGVGGANTYFDARGFGDSSQTVYRTENDVEWAWQAMAGLRFRLAPNVSLGLGYRYFTTADTTYGYPPSPNFNVGFDGVRTHSVLFTFDWKFW